MAAQETRFLRDRQEIGDLLATYSRGIDRSDEALLVSCYQPDATHDHGMFQGSARDFVRYAVAAVRTMERTMHCLQHSLIDIKSETAAVGETYCIAYHRVSSRDGDWADHTVGMRYLDTYERRLPGHWLISRRVIAWEWTRIDPVRREWRLNDGYMRGQRNEEDPIYTLLGLRRANDFA